MDHKRNRLLLVLTVPIILLGWLVMSPNVSAESKGAQTETDDPRPGVFKVYSKDGRESLGAVCTPKSPNPDPKTVHEVTCAFVYVRFVPPPERPKGALWEIVLMELIEKEDPKLAEEVKRNPKRLDDLKREMNEELKDQIRPICSGEGGVEKKLHDPQIGPKRKKYFQGLLEACSAKDPFVVMDRLSSIEFRTCKLSVDTFSIDFKRIGEGKWLYTSGPRGVCSTLKMYLLEREGLSWTLSETYVQAGKTTGRCEGVEEELHKRTTWSWRTLLPFELPCDFINH